MPSKKVTITTKPQERRADEWVNGADANASRGSASAVPTPLPGLTTSSQESAAPFKRLTIDIPDELHARIKSQCALRRTKMADEIRALLENHFPA